MNKFQSKHKRTRGSVGLSAIILVLCFIIFTFSMGVKLLTGTSHKAKGAVDSENSLNSHATEDSHNPTLTVDKPNGEVPVEKPWYLTLVNKDNVLPEDYTVSLAEVGSNHQVDERIADSLTAMLKACRKKGLDPMICSSYRSNETQQELFDAQVKKWQKKGMGYEEALSKAKTTVAYPGTSEHQLGLAVDIVSVKYQVLDNKQEDTKVFKWLKEHCADYGFIVRYPPDKTNITGIIYEPWHFRYVGVETAQEIMSKGITLEEYLAN